MHGFADDSENELVKKINLYLSRLNLATATLRYTESPISPTIYATAMELKNYESKGKKEKKIY